MNEANEMLRITRSADKLNKYNLTVSHLHGIVFVLLNRSKATYKPPYVLLFRILIPSMEFI